MSIDSMIPIGRGQRELIIGDRSTGKTTIAIDTIINQAQHQQPASQRGRHLPRGLPPGLLDLRSGRPKNSNIARTINLFEKAGAMEYTTIVSASAADNPANQYIAPFSGALNGRILHAQRHGCAHRL